MININYFLTKRGELPNDWSPYIYMHFLSYNKNIIPEISRIDKYTFIKNKSILKYTLLKALSKKKSAFKPFIRKNKINEETLFYKVKKYYKWTDREANQIWKVMKPIIYSNKEMLKLYFRKFGIDKTYYDKYGLEWKKRKKVGLESWM